MIDRKQRDELILKISYIKNEFAKINTKQYKFDGFSCQIKVEELILAFQKMFPLEKGEEYTEIIQGIRLGLLQINKIYDENDAEINEIITLCIELTDYLIKKLKTEEVRKEVYFLPYKLDMWDSLESIWKILNEDEYFNAYVMPIPWAERDIDGSVKTWHFELEEFSQCVPVVDYRNRDLAVVKPDVIFIHNPYDGENLATTVDSRFYSENLKKCTDTLIYVPYFVVGDKISPDKCQTPAVHYADYVIVQDENIKKQYEDNYLWGDPKNKFLPFGSPKFDKVLSTSRQDYKLPIEWKQKIKGKKVILYNTSINDMMWNDEYYIDKLKSVFAYFRDRDDVVLWWRPHPLLKTSINTVRPELYTEFCDLEKQYIDGGEGIYDNTYDMNRAIACSDAYYGDRSSLVWLYKMTGKPVMIQDYRKINTGFNMRSESYFLTTDGRGASWFTQRINGWQALCQMDNCSGEITIIDILPNSYSKGFSYGAISYFDDKIIIVPWEEIVPLLIYDLKARSFSTETDMQLDLKKSNVRFFLEYALENDDDIFFISPRLDVILQFSKKEKKFKLNHLNIEGYIVEWSCINDNIIALACGNVMGIIDTKNWSVRWERLPEKKRIYTMNFVDQMIWIICAEDNQILCYDINEHMYSQFLLKNINEKRRIFWGLIQHRNYIIFLPGKTDFMGVYTSDEEKKTIEYHKLNLLNDRRSIDNERVESIDKKNDAWIALLSDGKHFVYANDNLVEFKINHYKNRDVEEIFFKTAYKCVAEKKELQDNIEILRNCIKKDNTSEKKTKKCAENILRILRKIDN